MGRAAPLPPSRSTQNFDAIITAITKFPGEDAQDIHDQPLTGRQIFPLGRSRPHPVTPPPAHDYIHRRVAHR